MCVLSSGLMTFPSSSSAPRHPRPHHLPRPQHHRPSSIYLHLFIIIYQFIIIIIIIHHHQLHCPKLATSVTGLL